MSELANDALIVDRFAALAYRVFTAYIYRELKKDPCVFTMIVNLRSTLFYVCSPGQNRGAILFSVPRTDLPMKRAPVAVTMAGTPNISVETQWQRGLRLFVILLAHAVCGIG